MVLGDTQLAGAAASGSLHVGFSCCCFAALKPEAGFQFAAALGHSCAK